MTNLKTQERSEHEKKLDHTGKAVLDHIYNQNDPVAYYQALSTLDYSIPDAVQPITDTLLTHFLTTRAGKPIKLIDLGCSYGITGQLLRRDAEMADLNAHYARYGDCSRELLITKDRDLRNKYGPEKVKIIGLDIATKACAYAIDSGAIDDAIVANYEEQDVSPSQADMLSGADLIVSTGFIGYASARSITKILDSIIQNTKSPYRPWMAHFVMRSFDYAPIQSALAERGYVTARGNWPVFQRQFATQAERTEIIERLIAKGCDPTGFEAERGIYAELYLSRPADELDQLPAGQFRHLLDTNDLQNLSC